MPDVKLSDDNKKDIKRMEASLNTKVKSPKKACSKKAG